jgi:hypothetical protein
MVRIDSVTGMATMRVFRRGLVEDAPRPPEAVMGTRQPHDQTQAKYYII